MGSNLYRRNSSGVASMVSAGSDVYQQKQEERMREPDWNYVSWVDELGVHHYGSFEEYHQWFMNQRLELEVPDEPMLMRGTPASHYYNRKGTMYDPWSDFDENGRLKGVDIMDRTDIRGAYWREKFRQLCLDILGRKDSGLYKQLLIFLLYFLRKSDIDNLSPEQQLALNALYRYIFKSHRKDIDLVDMWLDLVYFFYVHRKDPKKVSTDNNVNNRYGNYLIKYHKNYTNDSNNNGIPDYLEIDNNNNGIPDYLE